MIYTLAFPFLAAAIGYILGIAAHRWRVEGDPLVDTIIAMLPNAQCGQCGLPGCTEAAKALVAGDISPDFCPLGGNLLASQLAQTLGVSLSSGVLTMPQVAAISPELCDGCGRCFKVCPFDAIVGATRQLHGVVSDACTGCGQCVPVCPHSGIVLKPDPVFDEAMPKPSVKPLVSSLTGATHV